MSSIRKFINAMFNKETYINIANKINRFDMYILIFMKKHVQNKFLDKLMPVITSLGDLGFVWIVIAIALVLDKPYRMIGNQLLITLIISTIIGEGIVKHLIRRFRPCSKETDIKLLIKKPLSYSFPSGHTLSSFAAASVLSAFFAEYSLIFMGLAILIALSRIYLYVHYPTDVIAGIVFGLLCSRLVFIVI